jgi:hypothetical protein
VEFLIALLDFSIGFSQSSVLESLPRVVECGLRISSTTACRRTNQNNDDDQLRDSGESL